MKKLTAVKMGINGEGIAYDGRLPVFCTGALPGEEILAEITETNERWMKAETKKILKASEEHRESPCPYQNVCGGCGLLHMNYPAQLKAKKELLAEALWKYGHVSRELIREVHASAETLSYRSACKLPVQEADGRLVTGMYMAGTNRFVPIEHCPAHTPELETMRLAVLDILNKAQMKAYDARKRRGVRYLVLRTINSHSQLTLVTGRESIPDDVCDALFALAGMDTVAQSVNTEKRGGIFGTACRILRGSETIPAITGDITLQLSPASFYQLNTKQADELYRMAVQKINPCGRLIEVCCGIGGMSLLAKDKASEIIGVEYVPEAVENANAAAVYNHCDDHVRFVCGDAGEEFERLSAEKPFHTLLADPPRTGLDDRMLEAIKKYPPKRIIYISCNPATLGRNLHFLKQCHYQVRTVIPYDLFPNSPHIESLTVLER
ncbi:MAG: 23S rRNA (uracil(1939)-C(5))-methyltransferase RlmD [Solobacterium sp.]|nr:23S rRNA (uracil(1939)-C(5))-methyltransferase RlmD [Solobacterium sp.]